MEAMAHIPAPSLRYQDAFWKPYSAFLGAPSAPLADSPFWAVCDVGSTITSFLRRLRKLLTVVPITRRICNFQCRRGRHVCTLHMRLFNDYCRARQNTGLGAWS
jgi:hypothetical protein